MMLIFLRLNIHGVKSSMAASDTDSPTFFLYIIVFYQCEMYKYDCHIFVSLRPKLGKNVKYLLKYIFYVWDGTIKLLEYVQQKHKKYERDDFHRNRMSPPVTYMG